MLFNKEATSEELETQKLKYNLLCISLLVFPINFQGLLENMSRDRFLQLRSNLHWWLIMLKNPKIVMISSKNVELYRNQPGKGAMS